jgi:hypothetical protein
MSDRVRIAEAGQSKQGRAEPRDRYGRNKVMRLARTSPGKITWRSSKELWQQKQNEQQSASSERHGVSIEVAEAEPCLARSVTQLAERSGTPISAAINTYTAAADHRPLNERHIGHRIANPRSKARWQNHHSTHHGIQFFSGHNKFSNRIS